VDVAFEAAGGPQTLPVLLNCTAVAGTAVTVGHPGAVDINITRDINMRYITLKGVFGRRLWDTWELLVDLVESGRLDLEGIVTEQVELEDFERAFALLEQGAGKVIIHP
jgi:threonine 3-dehydrogenase